MINVEKLVIDPLTPLENQEIIVAALNCKRLFNWNGHNQKSA